MRRAVGAIVLAIAAASASLSLSCGGGPPPAAAPREMPAQWQDVFDGTPDIYVVVRPQAIKRDAVYGQLFKSLMRMAQARTEMRGVTSLEAMEGCEEIIVGLRKGDGELDDAAMIFRGVPASLDAAKMADASGRPMLRLVDAKTKVPEYQWADRRARTDAGETQSGSLFVLPDRTWVGAMGEARARARQAFASPFGRPTPKVDPQALASVRLDAAAFFATPRFQKSSALGPLVKRLRSLTVALMPGKGGVVATMQYEDEDAAAWSELRVKQLVEELGKAAPPPPEPTRPGRLPPPRRFTFEWLKDAVVTHTASAVVVKLPIPPRLLEELPNATGADLSL